MSECKPVGTTNILDLLKRLKVAEAAAALRIHEITEAQGIIAITGEYSDNLVRGIADAVAASGNRKKLVIFHSEEHTIKGMDDSDMLANGWIRAPEPEIDYKCKECDDKICGGTGVYEGRACDGIPF